MTGVHSIERTAQEDTLLVLFNTALSNLVRLTLLFTVDLYLTHRSKVLFRNNFALSRDITGTYPCTTRSYLSCYRDSRPLSKLSVLIDRARSSRESIAFPIHVGNHYQGADLAFRTEPL